MIYIFFNSLRCEESKWPPLKDPQWIKQIEKPCEKGENISATVSCRLQKLPI